MGGEWNEVPLSALADLSGGFAFKSKDYAPSGRFVLRTLNITDDCSINRVDAVYLPEKQCPAYSRFELRPEDTLFVMVGATLGKVGFIRKKDLPALLNQNMWLIRAKPEKACARFVHYAFRHVVKESLGWASGSARDFVRRDDYRKMEIPAPSLPEQRAIAHILGTLDDKIELNRRMNETLEAMARALFKSWFVDFDPVRAKCRGEPMCSPQSGQVPKSDHAPHSGQARRPAPTEWPQHILDLFPDRFVDSELGEIPEGWEVGPLVDVLSQRVERCVASSETAARPYVPIDCISPRSLCLTDSKNGKEAKSSLTKFYKGDILFGAMRPYFHKVCIAPFDGTTRTTAFVLYPKQEDDLAFAALLLHSPETIDFATRHSTGSTIPYAVWSDSMEDMPAVIPPSDLRAAFNDVARPMLDRISQSYFESHTLAALRDTLLPKLISGELRVKDAEKFIGRVI